MPKFDDPFLSYYEQERANLIQQIDNMQSGKWKLLDHSLDITAEHIQSTARRLAQLDALADKLAGE
jgi:hypothetical protein